jgi:hypothetical protein
MKGRFTSVKRVFIGMIKMEYKTKDVFNRLIKNFGLIMFCLHSFENN